MKGADVLYHGDIPFEKVEKTTGDHDQGLNELGQTVRIVDVGLFEQEGQWHAPDLREVKRQTNLTCEEMLMRRMMEAKQGIRWVRAEQP